MSVEIKDWSSEAQLMEYSRNSPGSLLIGKDSEAPRKYFSATVEMSYADNLEVCIISSGSGITPGILLNEAHGYIAVGYDNVLCFIDVISRRIRSKHILDGVFFEFLTTLASGDIVLVHELGLVRFDKAGKVIWTLGTDILERCTLVARDVAAIYLVDGEDPLIVSLDTGVVKKG